MLGVALTALVLCTGCPCIAAQPALIHSLVPACLQLEQLEEKVAAAEH